MDAGTLPTPKGSAGLMVGPSLYEAHAASNTTQLQSNCCRLGGLANNHTSVSGSPEQHTQTHAFNSKPIHRVAPYAFKAKEMMPKCISRPPGSCPAKGWDISQYCEACHG